MGRLSLLPPLSSLSLPRFAPFPARRRRVLWPSGARASKPKPKPTLKPTPAMPMTRRAFCHDYCARCFYLIILLSGKKRQNHIFSTNIISYTCFTKKGLSFEAM